VSPWGLQTKGKKTRHNKRTDSMIVQRRRTNGCNGLELPRRYRSASFAQERSIRRFASREKVQTASQKNDRRPIKTWSRRSMVIPTWWVSPSRCITGACMFRAGVGEHGRSQARRIRPTRTFKAHSGDKKVSAAE